MAKKNSELSIVLDQKCKDLTIAVGNLVNYQEGVRKGKQKENKNLRKALKAEIGNAQEALNAIKQAVKRA